MASGPGRVIGSCLYGTLSTAGRGTRDRRRGPRLMARMSALLLVAWSAEPDAAIRLDGWAGKAVAVPLAGPGVEQFRLTASVRWDRRAAGTAIRVVTPDGTVATQPIPPGQGPGSR